MERQNTGTKNTNFIQKPADWEDGGLVAQRTTLLKLELRLLLYEKGRGCGWLLQTFRCLNLLFLHLSRRSAQSVPIKLQWDNCCILFCHFLIIPLSSSLEAEPQEWASVYFRLEAIFFYKRYRASMTKHRQQNTKIRAKGIDPIWSQVYFSLLQDLHLCCKARGIYLE